MTDLIKHYRRLLGIAKGWAEKELPGWCDDLHRDLLMRHGAVMLDGRVSASSMNMPQLANALEDYERRGWPRSRNFNDKSSNTRKAVPPRISNIFKLWAKLGQAGKINDTTRGALLKWCGRQVGRSIDNLDVLSSAECMRVTEALKAWFNR